MKRALRAAFAAAPFLILAVPPAYALFDNQSPGIIRSGPYISAGAGQYAVSISSATTLTVPTNAVMAEICVETASARYTDDGTTPNSTTGIPVAAGQCFAYAGPLSAFKIIGSGATIDVSYYK